MNWLVIYLVSKKLVIYFTPTNLIFLKVNLNERKKHAVFCLLHPNYKKAIWDRRRSLDLTNWRTKHWDVDLPFLNTNFYLYQLNRNFESMINWHYTSEANRESGPQSQGRLKAWIHLFENLVELTIGVQDNSTVCTAPFPKGFRIETKLCNTFL